MEVAEIFTAFEQMKVLVVGDVMLDVYLRGEVERISPEAPVPVVRIQEKESRAGGAANVAVNCRALGTKVAVASVTGLDDEGAVIKQLLEDKGINTDPIKSFPDRTTTTKTRIISRNQQIIRFDSEEVDELSTSIEHDFIDGVLKQLQIQKPDVLIFEDYNKGLLKENVIKQIIRHCKILNIPVAVDPKNKNFLAYKGATIFKPNLKEVREGLNLRLTEVDLANLTEVHNLLLAELNHRVSFITLSDMGVFYGEGSNTAILPSYRRFIADVSGAGDTVIAVASLVYALTGDVSLMASWANLAGGLVCEEAGVIPIDKRRFIMEIKDKLGKNNQF